MAYETLTDSALAFDIALRANELNRRLQGSASVPPPPTAPAQLLPDGRLNGAITFRRAPIPAGGFVTGFDISSDGKRMLHWADVWNGYIRDAGDTEWRELLRRDTLPPGEYDPLPATKSTDTGVFGARMAPSNKDVIYASWRGFLFKSVNGGKAFTRTAMRNARMASNLGAIRRANPVIDVHPDDPNRVIVGTNNDGVHVSFNGGTTFAEVAGLPATTKDFQNGDGKYLVGFDPRNTANVYIHAFGTGLFRSINGLAGPFTPVGGPATAACLVISKAGTVYVCQLRTSAAAVPNALWCFKGDQWSQIPGTTNADQVAVDPFDENHIVTTDENGSSFRQSLDGGATFIGHPRIRGDGETAWLSNRSKPIYPAEIGFDPVVPGKLWMAEGVGFAWAAMPKVQGETIVWHDFSNGNAELAPTRVVSIPGSPPIMCFWDKPFWRLDDAYKPVNMWSYPVPAGGTFNEGTVTVGYGVDWAIDDPQFLVGVAGQGDNRNGFSINGGKSWTQFATKPPATSYSFGGSVAVSTKANFVLLATNNSGGVYTKDGGATWHNVSFGGYDPVTRWNNAYYVNRANVAADKTRPGVFAAVVSNIYKLPDGRDATGRDIAGLWVSRDGAQTWTQAFKGCLQTTGRIDQFWQCELQYVPGHPGELLYADMAGHKDSRLVWMTDDGKSKTEIDSVRDVGAFGFGKAADGHPRPAVYLIATIGSRRGLWASFDWFATPPQYLTDSPLGTLSTISDIEGDLNIFGRVYAMIGGNGAAVADFIPKAAL